LTTLDQVLTARRVDEQFDSLTIPPGFGQGKATFGGLSVGACVRSLQSRITNEARKLRSVSAQLVGAPQPGEAQIQVRLLRESATVQTLCADLEQDGKLMAHVVGVFANNRSVPDCWNFISPPPAPHWQTVEPLKTDNSQVPEFTRHFEYRSIGPLPYAGSAEDPLGYIRPSISCKVRDGAYWACLIDAWWLAALGRFGDLRPAVTLTYTTELHWPEVDLESDDPVLHVGKTLVSREGYSLETRELWTTDGRLVSTGTQVVAIIK
jgi:acyl-CoA thioesterase